MTYVLTKCCTKVRTSVRKLIIVLGIAKKLVRKATEATKKREVKGMRKVLADRLFELRTDAELSQARLAEIAGVDRKTINRIENGHFSPALDTIVRLRCAWHYAICIARYLGSALRQQFVQGLRKPRAGVSNTDPVFNVFVVFRFTNTAYR